MKNVLLILFILFISLTCAIQARAQSNYTISIFGPTTVCLNSTVTYTAVSYGTYNCPLSITYSWFQYPAATVVAGGGLNDNYITLRFSTPVTGMALVVTAKCSTTSIKSHNINISTLNAVQPTVSNVSIVSICTSQQATLVASPGSGGTGVRWYENATGGSVLSSSNTFKTPQLTSNKTYYVATAYGTDQTSNCNESTRKAVTVTVNSPPFPPAYIEGGGRCNPGSLSIKMTVGLNGNALKWYSQPTGGTAETTTLSTYNITHLSETTNYFVSSYNTNTGCESDVRIPVTAYVWVTPIPTATDVIKCYGQSVTLSASIDNPSLHSIRWYDAAVGGNLLTTSPNHPISSLTATTTVYAEGYYSYLNCPSTVRLPVTANLEQTPAAPAPVTGNSRFGPGTLTLETSGAPQGGSYQWINSANTVVGTSNTYETPQIYIPVFEPVTLTNYMSVRAVSPNGCPGPLRTFDAYIASLPLISGPTTVIKNQKVILSTSQSYDSYQWRNENNLLVATTSTYETNIPGKYKLTVTKTGVNGSGISPVHTLNEQFYGQNKNYIVTEEFLVPGVTNPTSPTIGTDAIRQSVEYFDGLGRPIQTVSVQSSPNKQDIIQPVSYDALNRQSKKYLPYAATGLGDGRYKTNAIGTHSSLPTEAERYNASAQYQYYQNADNVAHDVKPFSETIFEPSPLNRVIKQGAPGLAWQPNTDHTYNATDHTVKYSYEFNQANEVFLFNYDLASGLVTRSAGADGFYTVNQLYANKTKDEQNNEVIEYVDKEGRTVCKKVQSGADANGKLYASTYYIYDDFGNLVVVLPPEAVKNFTN